MSKSRTQFYESIKDAEELLEHFDTAKRLAGGPPPPSAEVLKRAGLILAITAWETYVEDRARESLEASLKSVPACQIVHFVQSKFDEEIKRFHNPNSEKTSKLFKDYLGTDVTAWWARSSGGSKEGKRKLDEWVVRRCEAAHRSPTATSNKPEAHMIKRDELSKLIKFLKSLVADTEAALL